MCQSQSVNLFLPANVHTLDLHPTRVELEDKTEPDQRPPLKLEPATHLPPPFRSTSNTVRFLVKDESGQWFEAIGNQWIPVPWPIP